MKSILLTLMLAVVGCVRPNISEPIPAINAYVPMNLTASVNCKEYIEHLCAGQKELTMYQCGPARDSSTRNHSHHTIVECDGNGNAFSYDVEEVLK
jgi:hypothetical protein